MNFGSGIHDAGRKMIYCIPRQWLYVGQICCSQLLSRLDWSSLRLQSIHTIVEVWSHPRNIDVCFLNISLFVKQQISYFGKLTNSSYL